ncbi:MAG: hypothetical protein KIS76_03995 [Pyrinomonadaceae bacterium]|nr:hypothetical protein [Pyrinomonadaceae bacterium]
MDDKLAKLKEKHELEEWELLSGEAREKLKEQALMFLGGIHTVGKLSEALSSQEMRALETFQKERLYHAFGFQTFVEFLGSDYSRMTKSQYYERLRILDIEGDRIFDLLNDAGLSVSKRKLLGKGNIQLDGETLIVVGDDGDETEIEISDRSRILETLSALADANADKSRKIERGEADNKRLKEKVVELENTPGARGRLSPMDEAAAGALVHLAALAAQIEQSPVAEIDQFLHRDFNLLVAQWNRINYALADNGLSEKARELTESDEDRIAALLDDGLL